MNGTIVFGVVLIAVAAFSGGPWLVPMLIGGVAIIAWGAFMTPTKTRISGQKRIPSESDPFV